MVSLFSPSILAISRLLRRSPALAPLAHGHAVITGIHHHPLLVSALISAYSHLGLASLSRLVFFSSSDHIANPLLWNSLLAACSRCYLFSETLSLFPRMRLNVNPDQFTLAVLFKASTELSDFPIGTAIHSLVMKLAFSSDVILSNTMMVFYFKCGRFADARRVFDEMLVRSVSSWNTLISEYVKSEDDLIRSKVWDLVLRMQVEGLKPDGYTVSVLLPQCSSEFVGRLHGRAVHCYVIRHGMDLSLDVHVGSGLIYMYVKGKHVDLGRRVFERMGSKNVVSWTAMIAGYVENGEFEEALNIFRAMQSQGEVFPNKVTIVSLLPAVGSLGSISEGKQIHGFGIRACLKGEASFNNALIDMYSKCGSLGCAKRVFDDQSWDKDIISWSSMISCYGVHGSGEDAIALFHKMHSLGIKLDHITSVVLLSACRRTGLIAKGIEIYNSLIKDHGIVPTVEVCSSMVDMFGRAGELNQALDFINSMPLAPGPSVWGALFDASVIHNNQKMQNLAHRFLRELEPENASNYVSLSNSLASSGRWDLVAKVRMRMKEAGMKKMPGCSWINVNSTVHSFYVADKSHQSSDMIYERLNNLLLAMKADTCIPDMDNLALAL